tara:strand:+ start:201 stop:344 length:144 start_codon:yes stop_codon:yes gene_type:complete
MILKHYKSPVRVIEITNFKGWKKQGFGGKFGRHIRHTVKNKLNKSIP